MWRTRNRPEFHKKIIEGPIWACRCWRQNATSQVMSFARWTVQLKIRCYKYVDQCFQYGGHFDLRPGVAVLLIVRQSNQIIRSNKQQQRTKQSKRQEDSHCVDGRPSNTLNVNNSSTQSVPRDRWYTWQLLFYFVYFGVTRRVRNLTKLKLVNCNSAWVNKWSWCNSNKRRNQCASNADCAKPKTRSGANFDQSQFTF